MWPRPKKHERTGAVNLSPHFFKLTQEDLKTVAPAIRFAAVEQMQEGIIHHEVIDHIADNEPDEQRAMAKKSFWR